MWGVTQQSKPLAYADHDNSSSRTKSVELLVRSIKRAPTPTSQVKSSPLPLMTQTFSDAGCVLKKLFVSCNQNCVGWSKMAKGMQYEKALNDKKNFSPLTPS